MEKEINLKDITEEIIVPAVVVEKEKTNNFIISNKDLLLKIKKVRPVVKKDEKRNFILLDHLKKPEIKEKLSSFILEDYKIIKKSCDFTYQELLSKIIKDKKKIPSSFEIIGDIAIINLRYPLQLKNKKQIGEAILLTNKNIKSIYNKTEKLDNKFRTPKLELLAGLKKKETIVTEQKIKIKLNISEVYYCSRLHSERQRVSKYLKNYDIIVDVFCGVGPFSLLAAKNLRCKVYANDLNPFCFKYLKENIILNKLQKYMESFCKDGRDFIRFIFEKIETNKIHRVDHFYMNLPALAIEFLDAFVYTPEKLLKQGFYIHVYCFHEKEENEELFINGIKKRIEDRLGKVFSYAQFKKFHFLKQVSSAKIMMCVSIWMEKKYNSSIKEGINKKLKTQ